MRTSVCVFCGSRPGNDPRYLEIAVATGIAIAKRGLTLVYGGAQAGLMGALANAALGAGGRVVGVMPKAMTDREIAHRGLAELHITSSMHERKEKMIALSDAFLALPGGFGTYDELFETLTLGQIGQHEKPNALLNALGFFDPLLALFRHTVATGFAPAEHAGLVVVGATADEVLDGIQAWQPVREGRLLDRAVKP